MPLMTTQINPLAFLELDDLPPAPDSPDIPNAVAVERERAVPISEIGRQLLATALPPALKLAAQDTRRQRAKA